MIVGTINNKIVSTEFVRLDDKEFVEKELDISNIYSTEELLEKISEMNIDDNKLYKIVLIGNRNFEINIYKLYKMIEIRNIIKFKDKTRLGYELEKIANDSTLKGIFAKEMISRLQEENVDKEVIEKAIEIGINSLS